MQELKLWPLLHMAVNMKDNGLGNILWKIIIREKLQVKCNCYGEKIFRFQV